MTPPLNPEASVDSRNYEEHLGLAVAAVQQAGTDALSIREAAKAFNVSRSTLSDRLNGKST